jgi:hypothetical protein
MRGPLGPRGDGLLERFDQLVRQEVTTVADNGEIVTHRTDHGAVTAVDPASISVSLANGEIATATIDSDTQVVSIDVDERPFADDATVADITVGADVLVSSESQADGSYLAERILIVPAQDEEATDEAAAEASPAAVS